MESIIVIIIISGVRASEHCRAHASSAEWMDGVGEEQAMSGVVPVGCVSIMQTNR